MDNLTPEAQDIEVLTPSALEAQTRAEYDQSIVTAHRFPRSLDRFLKTAETYATINPEVAASMEYAKPVKGKAVKGPSARLAEIVAATYGNIRVQARVIAETNTEVVAQGIAHDLETNVAQSTEVTVSIVTKEGKRYSSDLIATVRAAACAKARRNAIFLVVPASICMPIIEAARRVAAGDAKTFPQRRKATLDWLIERGITTKLILEYVEREKVEDITLDDMSDLVAIKNAASEEGTDLHKFFEKATEERLEKAKYDSEGLKMGALRKDNDKKE